jgi:DMSO reductase anchor subunit
MGQFLRIAAIVFLVLIGFGFGLCGLFGLGLTLFEVSGWQHSDKGLILVISIVSLLVATGSFFAVRALARKVRAARELRRAGTSGGAS